MGLIDQAVAVPASRRIKVGIDGASSTGKTTLTRQLCESFASNGVQERPEPTRAVAPRFGVNSASDWPRLHADRPRLRQFLSAEMRLIAADEASDVSLICDCSRLLAVAYEAVLLRWKPTTALRRVSQVDAMTYDVYLYCPLTPGGADDGFRYLAFREQVDSVYRQLSSDLGPRLVVMPLGSRRRHEAEATLRQRFGWQP